MIYSFPQISQIDKDFFHDNKDNEDNIDFVEGRRHLSIAQASLALHYLPSVSGSKDKSRFALPLMLADCPP